MKSLEGRVIAISISAKKGMRKSNVDEAILIEDFGIEGDAHAGPGHRQVSLLALESIDTMRAKGLDVNPGDFAENIATEGLAVASIEIGRTVMIGQARIEITQIGKECHDRCAIFEQAGDCVMPREGVFGRVLKGGTVRVGDRVVIGDRS